MRLKEGEERLNRGVGDRRMEVVECLRPCTLVVSLSLH